MNLSMLSVDSVRETAQTLRTASASSGLRVRTDVKAGANVYDVSAYSNANYRR